MIIARLKGGLGNQMFQYAAGRTLSLLKNTELKIDTSFLDQNPQGAFTLREFQLDVFNIKAAVADKKDYEDLLKHAGSRLRRVLYRELPGLFNKAYLAESGALYHRKFKNYPANAYLDGYWQSEKYFESCREAIHADFSFVHPPSAENASLLERIKAGNSLSLHVRRGDYVSSTKINSVHGTCSPEYYSAALKLMREKHGAMKVFVFSDDIEWCKANLNAGENVIYISHNSGKNSYEDLRLMSNCRHNIIANSSFSWWGAWLNPSSSKTVVAPRNWFRTKDNPDIYPAEWICL
jgi:hypothetical protein